MIIKLTPAQIPEYWELIKHIATITDEVDEKDLQPYLNNLLNNLLSEKAQCFFRIKDKNILAVMITSIKVNKFNNDKSLFIENLFSFESVEDSQWEKDFKFINDFKESTGCSFVSFFSRNPRIWKLAEMVGFKEIKREFRLEG